VNIIREAGGLNVPFGMTQNVSGAASVMFIARKDVFNRKKTVSFRQIWIIARVVEFVRMNAGPVPLRW
jgi:hypothetical protein